MRFLVDGYNVTKQDPGTSSLDLEDQRESLVSRLAVRAGELLGRGSVVVVFDGVSGGGGDYHRGRVDVRFSRAGAADDLISELAGPDTTVVTSDTGLADRVRAEGARVLGREVLFADRTGTRRGRGRVHRGPLEGGLPPGANRITEELKKLWLEDEG